MKTGHSEDGEVEGHSEDGEVEKMAVIQLQEVIPPTIKGDTFEGDFTPQTQVKR